MLNFFTASLLGLIEGFTEFLPISSTAHLILASNLLKISETEFLKTFEIAIQSGAILSVIVLFFKKFLDLEVLKKIFVAFLPTGLIGFLLYKTVKSFLLGNIAIVLLSLALGGLFLILFEKFFKESKGEKDIKDISFKECLIIGACQALAVVPGISRSAATIIGGLALKIPRQTIVEFSFLLAVPTMFAATFFDLLKTSASFSSSEFYLLALGFIVSFFSAALSIKFLLNYIRRHSFASFGVYRLLLVFIFLLFAL
ncbi:MAG: undecaprenyl-diphosphate phosphatase [Candidatus Paceibacterota bacterium]